jgi:hypothetical protein
MKAHRASLGGGVIAFPLNDDATIIRGYALGADGAEAPIRGRGGMERPLEFDRRFSAISRTCARGLAARASNPNWDSASANVLSEPVELSLKGRQS